MDRSKIFWMNRKYGGEHYIKQFDDWTCLILMLIVLIPNKIQRTRCVGMVSHPNHILPVVFLWI